MAKNTGLPQFSMLSAPDVVQPIVLAANTGQAFDVPAGHSFVLFSLNADFYARYGSTSAQVPTTTSTGSTGSELNPTARNIGSTASCTGISIIAPAAASGSLSWFKPA